MVRQAPVKAHGMSEAARKAELLFETSTVAEIREVGGAHLQHLATSSVTVQLVRTGLLVKRLTRGMQQNLVKTLDMYRWRQRPMRKLRRRNRRSGSLLATLTGACSVHTTDAEL